MFLEQSKIIYSTLPIDEDTVHFNFPDHISLVIGRGAFSSTGYFNLVKLVEDAEENLKSGKRVVFNFDDTESISLDALAFLLGNIEYFFEIYGRNRINGTYAKNPEVNQLLIDSGFFARLRVKEKFGVEAPLGDKKILNMKFISSQYIDASTIAPLRDDVTRNEIKLSRIYERKIFRALSEAMLNVHHHAYDSLKFKHGKQNKIKGKWWLGAHYIKEDDCLCFVMYDIGLGIPATMPRNYATHVERISENGKAPTDADLIHLATRPGKTSTKKRHRGRGLPDMHQIVELNRGTMSIFSGYGHYHYDSFTGWKTNCPLKLRGTLVCWNVYTADLIDQE